MLKVTPNGMKIKTTKDKNNMLKAVDTEIEEMLKLSGGVKRITKENKRKPKTETSN